MDTPSTPGNASLSGNLQKDIGLMEKLFGFAKNVRGEAEKTSKAYGSLFGNAGGGSGNSLTTSPTFSSAATGVAGLSGGSSNLISRVGNLALGVASSAATMMPSVQDAVSNQLLTSQARFSGMQGNVTSQLRSAMMAGTTNSSFDALQAVAAGTANGILPGLPNYSSQIMPGVAQLSNLTGSMTSAMQATAALNKGSSVNTLRMIGVSARDSSGGMRNPADIFKDIYKFAETQAGRKLSPQDIAISMQSGNGLSNMLDAVSGGDSSLRNALQSSALQYSRGGDLSKGSLTKTGQLTGALNANSAMNASEFGLTSAAAKPMAQGFTEAANTLVKINDKLAGIVESSSQAAFALKQLAKGETLIGSKGGQGILGMGASVLGFLGGSALFKGIAARAGSAAAGANIGKFGGVPGLIAGTAAGLLLPGLLSKISNSSGPTGPGEASNDSNTNSLRPNTAIQTGLAPGSAAVSIALTQQGVPYSWGGGSNQGPTAGIGRGSNTVGFDCSSLVRFVMSKLGVALPRVSSQQQQCGKQISPQDAQPGDLLFWGKPAHHVAIYAGGGMMIQAPRTGGEVEKVPVNLAGVDTCSRVLDGATGTTALTNLLDSAGSKSGFDVSGFINNLSGNTASGTTNGFANSDMIGYSPESAMSGGSVSGSGLGLGDSTGISNSSNGMGQNYMYINTATGKLETAASSSGSASVINYGGVTIQVDTKGSQLTAKEVGKAVRDELKSLGINAKVVGK